MPNDHTFTVVAILDKHRADANGQHRVRLRVIYKSKAIYRATGFSATDDQFKYGVFTSEFPGATLANRKIELLRTEILDALTALPEVSLEAVRRAVLHGLAKAPQVSLFSFIDDMIKYESMIGRAEGTVKFYRKERNKLFDFRANLTWSDIDADVLEEYQSWLTTKRGNKPNTIAASFKFLNKVFNRAERKRVIDSNPLHEQFSRPRFVGSYREHLTVKEIKLLEKYIYDEKTSFSASVVGAWFLLGCYTGLRMSDVIGFNFEERIYGENIIVNTEKDNDTVSIPMHVGLKRLVKFLRELNTRCYCNQVCNRWLKIIMPAAKIKKHVTFHCSRHTFAVTYLELGGSLDALQAVLGHEDLRTTAIYAKISNARVKREMKAWDKEFI